MENATEIGNVVIKQCSWCGNYHYITLTDDQMERMERIETELIQVLFPDLQPVEREFLRHGTCPECQASVFGEKKTDIIHKCQQPLSVK